MSSEGRTVRSGPPGRFGAALPRRTDDPGRRTRFGSPWATGPVALVALALLVGACAGATADDAGPEDSGAPGGVDPDLTEAEARAVTVGAGVCGSAGPGLGSGIALDGDRVLTAAHVVASGGPVEVAFRGRTVDATIEAYDPARDLAVVRPASPLPSIPPAPPLRRAAEDQTLTIVGANTSDRLEATVTDVTRIEIDEVRGTGRSIRDGYILEAASLGGDSGAGLYDDEGHLVGVLFAVSTEDGGRSWATAANEIEAFLDEPEHRGSFGCDADESQIGRLG